MILIIGGRASGKLDYVRNLGYEDHQIAHGVLDDRPVLYNLQDLVFADPKASSQLLEVLLKKEVVVCHEVGSGIIPAKAEDREAREATGRLCNRLAAQADQVIRLVCGLPLIIKDRLPKSDRPG
ncbi:MAG TPA: bifunctional adenosylcobinamide kinase/adenosylcobinamide-phosphate guanylyltransferase [Clostridia bacterium]|nr:bifunctional adenosylcobinamide kinase/adenosylcobinamide-phosphate guanylyltransferase [Clostridia bacterium]